jgi:uncharacterized protein YuzE
MMTISYDPSVDALYVRFMEGPAECEVIRLNDRVAINLGPDEQVVGLEVLDASEILPGLTERKVHLENLVPA